MKMGVFEDFDEIDKIIAETEMASEIDDKVKRIIEDQTGFPSADMTLTTSLLDDAGVDSLDMIEIVMAIEEEFGIDIPDEDIEKIKTIQDVVEYIDGHKQ